MASLCWEDDMTKDPIPFAPWGRSLLPFAATWRYGLYVKTGRDQYRVHVIRTLLRFSYFSQQENESRGIDG